MNRYEIDLHFVEFVSASERMLRRTAYLLCGDWQRAEDAVQNALIKVYLNWTKIERREVVIDVVPEAVSSVSAVDGVDDRLLLRQALAALPPRQRAVVVLRYVDDLDVADTALALRCTPGTVTSAATRALASMRAFLIRHGVVRGAASEGRA